MQRHHASVKTERRGQRIAQQPRVPRYRRVVVLLLIVLAPVVGTLNFVSLSTAARSATVALAPRHGQRVRIVAETRSSGIDAPDWSRLTGWIGNPFHYIPSVSMPHVVGPASNR
jgi:hypothetical protein